MKSAGARQIFAATLAAGWGLSLMLPALEFDFGRSGHPVVLAGWKVLDSGWIDMAAFQFAWLGNPLLFAVLAMMLGFFPDRWSRIIGALLVLSALDMFDLFLRPEFYTFVRAHSGAYLWLAVSLSGGLYALFLHPRIAMTPNDSPI